MTPSMVKQYTIFIYKYQITLQKKNYPWYFIMKSFAKHIRTIKKYRLNKSLIAVLEKSILNSMLRNELGYRSNTEMFDMTNYSRTMCVQCFG